MHRTRKGVLALLNYFGCPTGVKVALVDNIELFLSAEGDGISLVSTAKWLFEYPLAKFLKEEITERTGNPFKSSRKIREWFRCKMYKDSAGKAGTSVHAQMWYSWFQLKRIAPTVPDSFIGVAIEKHRAAMANEEPVTGCGDRQEVLDQLTRRVLPSFGKEVGRRWREGQHLWAPSVSACLQLGRSQTSGFLHREWLSPADVARLGPECNLSHYFRFDGRRAKSDYFLPRWSQTVTVGSGAWSELVPLYKAVRGDLETCFWGNSKPALQWAPDVLLWEPVYDEDPILVYSRHVPAHARALIEVAGTIHVVPLLQTVDEDTVAWNDFLVDCAWVEYSESPRLRLRCEVEAILEPLKVRTITKGPAACYTLCRAWQKAVHGVLREAQPFKLTGRTITPEDVEGIRMSAPGCVWQSIDYSAATDKISCSLSRAIVFHLTNHMSVHEAAIVKASLAPHTVGYRCVQRLKSLAPERRLELSSDVDQMNGQLMGSPVSFPILCLINYGTILAADAEFFDRESARLKPEEKVLINGDDALVHRPPEWRKIHERIARNCGLTYSTGKAYSDPHYANMNSVGFFDLTSFKGSGGIVENSYIPFAALLGYGQEKTVGRSEEDDLVVDGGRVQALRRALEVGQYPNKLLKLALKSDLFQKKLSEEVGWRNLFLPEVFGGMGLEAPRGWKFAITEKQMSHAHYKWIQGRHTLSRDILIPELRIEESSTLEDYPAAADLLQNLKANPLDRDIWLDQLASGGRFVVNDRRFLRQRPRVAGEIPPARKLEPSVLARAPDWCRDLPKGWTYGPWKHRGCGLWDLWVSP